jgi:mono/diheme cytochrome c family protein
MLKKGITALVFVLIIMVYVFGQAKPVASSGSKISIERGKKVYATYCLSCHQADGSGVPHMNPPLKKTKWVKGSKGQLINVILKGMKEEVEINDEMYTNVMAPHAFLSDQEIADVLSYIRSSFGNKASAVTVAEVKAAREKAK